MNTPINYHDSSLTTSFTDILNSINANISNDTQKKNLDYFFHKVTYKTSLMFEIEQSDDETD